MTITSIVNHQFCDTWYIVPTIINRIRKPNQCHAFDSAFEGFILSRNWNPSLMIKKIERAMISDIIFSFVMVLIVPFVN